MPYTMSSNWLPPLVYASDYGNNWNTYVRTLYRFFTTDFIESRPELGGQPVNLVNEPLQDGKHVTFWHIISEGPDETSRLPNYRRCERIRWPRPVIEHTEDQGITIWENKRHGQKRVCIWLENADYLVILTKRSKYLLLLTAYPIDEAHTRRKLRKEYEDYIKANAALQDGTVTPSTHGR